MSDAIRSTEGEAWIPRPHGPAPAQRRRRDDGAFDERLRDGTLTPRRRPARREPAHDDATTTRRPPPEDGLGGGLDLLA